MMFSLHLLVFLQFVSIYIAVHIEWKHWVDLPINDSQLLVTNHNHSIFVITNNAIVYKIDASLSASSSKALWHNISTHGINPGLIEIKNDNYLTMNEYTYIFNPPIEKSQTIYKIYSYNHNTNEFSNNVFPIQPSATQTGNPCVVHQAQYIYLIGGTTFENPEKIICSSVLSVYNLNTTQWNTYDNLPFSTCYSFCQIYQNFIYLFGGVVTGKLPAYLQGVYTVNITNGSHKHMTWSKVNNDTIENGILYSHSILVNNIIYVFARGQIQTVEIHSETNIILKEIQNDNLKRCFTGNVYDSQTDLIYVIGGSGCNDHQTFYCTAQISQHMTPSNNEKLFWGLTLRDWTYIVFVICCALMCIVGYICCGRRNQRNKQQHFSQKKHLQQDILGNAYDVIVSESIHESIDEANAIDKSHTNMSDTNEREQRYVDI